MKKGLLLSLFLALFFALGSAWAQVTISGRVTSSEDGQGLPGVNVVLKGTAQGTVTDVEGNYTLSVPEDPNAVVTFSFVGFTPQDRPVGSGGAINIVLSPDVKELNETVVVGYGTQNRRDLTGSIASVGSKDFQKGVITNPEQLIAGKVAGVSVTPNSGAPGAGGQIRIRGAASLNASNDPLIVIDGVPLDNGSISGSPNPLSLINPNDIENITILKDASAAAIYGSRASNGVIIITTKKGTIGAKPLISGSSMNSISFIRKKMDVLSADDFRKFVLDSGTADQIALLDTARFKGGTDWQKEIYQPAWASDNNISFTGGLKLGDFALPYRVSGGFLHQEGILKTDKMDRVTAALNLTPTFLDGHLKLNLNLKGSQSKHFFANHGAIGSAAAFDPTKPIRSESPRYGGYYEWLDEGSNLPTVIAPRNPVALLYNRDDRSNVLRSVGNAQLDYVFHGFEDLRANVNLGYDISEGKGNVFINDSAATDYRNGGRHTQYYQKRQNKLFETYLNYTKQVSSIHSRFDVMAGYSFQDFFTRVNNYYILNYTGDTIPTEPVPSFPFDKPQNRLMSFYGRLNYAFYERYLLTATIRRDGSSRFAKDNRWGWFPSLALAWRIKDEAFLRNANFLNDLKLRAGYGLTGQQDIGRNYGYLSIYGISNSTAQYPLGDQFFNMYRPNAYDPNIQWESTVTYNAGIDFAFANSRIAGAIDVYQKNTSDLLSIVPTPAGTNFGDEVLTNIGAMQNRGIEFTLNTVPVQTNSLRWDVGFNVTYNQNEITRLRQIGDSSFLGFPTGGISGGVGTNIQIQTAGHPINSYYVYKQKYDANGKPVESANLLDMFEDLNGDTAITAEDRYHNKQAAPKIFFGFNTSLTWKAFSLTATFRGALQNYVYNNVSSERGNYNYPFLQTTYLTNFHSSAFETDFAGDVNVTERLQSDYYVQRADYVRLDNLILSYNLGTMISPRFGLTLSAGVQNAFVLTKYKGVDPEIPNGIDNAFYARPRTFTAGLNISFQ